MRRENIKKILPFQAVIAIVLLGFGISWASAPKVDASLLTDQVRHELRMLPYYSVFDDITFTIKDKDTVLLTGKVTQNIVKSDAVIAVKTIKGVDKVIDDIKLLPLSRSDDSIRWRTYLAIFRNPGFEKYAIQVDPPLRIIVDNGHVTLVGHVNNPIDKKIADISARTVPGVFSVTDNIRVDQGGRDYRH